MNAAAETERLRKALREIALTPAMPFPDPGAHSWRAWGSAVHLAWCQIQRIARAALSEEPTTKSDVQREFAEAMAPRQNPPHPMFRDHNCAYCKSGEKPCRYGNPSACGYPYARND